jgi:hypothetical protein
LTDHTSRSLTPLQNSCRDIAAVRLAFLCSFDSQIRILPRNISQIGLIKVGLTSILTAMRFSLPSLTSMRVIWEDFKGGSRMKHWKKIGW